MTYKNGYSVRLFKNLGYHLKLSLEPAEIYECKNQYKRMSNTFNHPIKNLSLVDVFALSALMLHKRHSRHVSAHVRAYKHKEKRQYCWPYCQLYLG